MWIKGSCGGFFRCDGHELHCWKILGRAAGRGEHVVHNCTCYEYSRLAENGSTLAGAVLSALADVRLVEGSIHEPRFVPSSPAEVMHAVFTYWNVLDRIMLEHSRSNYQTGYLREVQLRRMVQIARRLVTGGSAFDGGDGGDGAPEPERRWRPGSASRRHYCEVGIPANLHLAIPLSPCIPPLLSIPRWG